MHLFADEAAFWHARNAFYTTMLAKPRLFATDWFFEQFEQPARANMRRALRGALAENLRAVPASYRSAR